MLAHPCDAPASDLYPRKIADRALSQRIKDTYDDVEKGT
jgi:hypothetical protein